MSEENPVLESEDGAAEPEAGGDEQAPKNRASRFKSLERKLRNTEKELQALRQAKEQSTTQELSELERLKSDLQKRDSDLSSLTEKLRLKEIEHRFEQAALKAGVIDVDAAKRLANLSEVDIDEDGSIHGIEDVVADLKKARKYLFGPLTTPVGNAAGNPSAGPPGKVTADQVKRMSADELEKFAQTMRSHRL